MKFLIGHAGRAAAGQTVSGDAVRVVSLGSDSRAGVLVVVADGLGHGEHAATAAETVCRFAAEAAESPLDAILRRCGDELTRGRGAVAALLRLREHGALEFCGTGNVNCHAKTAKPISLISVPGILGRRTRPFRTFAATVAVGDLLLVHTDGVSRRFDLDEAVSADPQQLAEDTIARFGHTHDDATCVVVRCCPS
jgi:hypothetical protein